MSTMTKVFVVLTTVFAIVLSCMTVFTAAQWTNLRDNIADYQQLYQSELVRRMNTENLMAATLSMKDAEVSQMSQMLGTQKQTNKEQLDELVSLRNEVARRTNEAMAAEAGRKKLEEILEVQTTELTSTQKQNEVLLKENIDLQTRNSRLASRNLEVTSQLAIATDQIRNLQEKLYASQQRAKELEQAMASGQRTLPDEDLPDRAVPVAPPVVGPITGEITEVDGGYISINIGETSGVAPGMDFMVYRDSEYVGDFQVETVWPKSAGGRLTLVKSGRQVRTGDRVVFGLQGS